MTLKLSAFERYWRENHKKFPDEWPLEFVGGNEGMWDEQFQAFQLEHVEKNRMNQYKRKKY